MSLVSYPAGGSGGGGGGLDPGDQAFIDALRAGTASLEVNDLQAEIDLRTGSSCLVAATPDPGEIEFGRHEFRSSTTGIEFADAADGTVRHHARRLRGVFADAALWTAYDGDVITANGGTVSDGLQMPDATDATPYVVYVTVVGAGVTFLLSGSTMMGAASWTQAAGTSYKYVSTTGGDWMRFQAG